jgi:hypothetical protein
VVSGDRRERILRRIVGCGTPELNTKRICQVCAEVTGLTGAGIMLMSGNVPRGSLCATDEVSSLIEALQFALGEGPCVDAYHQDRPVLEPDLARPRTPRWLAFAGPAVEAGVRGIFGFPLQVGSVRLGALSLYCDRPGQLSDEQHADALVLADLSAQAVLVLQANALPGKLATALEAGGEFQIAVHQASGMLAAQLDASVGQALIRLRAYAFGHDRPLADVAGDVIARKLRFDARSGQKDPVR